MKLLNKKIIKSKSGITLVALVVTIVILLILAGITIATLFGENGIIKMAQKAKDETEKAQEETEKQLQNLANELSNTIGDKIESPNEWTQPDPLKPEITNGKITLKIGDYVDYDCTTSDATYTSPKEKTGYTEDQVFKANEYQYGWRVLGVNENKQLMLLSEDFVPLTGGGDRGNRTGQYYYLKGQAGYENGVEELNKICSIYGNGKGAVSARSINVDDVNKVTGYNPNNTGVKDPKNIGNGTKFRENQLDEYNSSIKYTLTTEGVKFEPMNGAKDGVRKILKFTYYDETSTRWKSLSTNENVTLINKQYYYYPTTLTETNDLIATNGIASNSTEYKMLFTNSSTGHDAINSGETENYIYWLGTRYINNGGGCNYFDIHAIANGGVIGFSTYISDEVNGEPYCGIRPVVTISSKINLKDSGTIKDGCKLYNIIIQ